jgi:hypothetical protein
LYNNYIEVLLLRKIALVSFPFVYSLQASGCFSRRRGEVAETLIDFSAPWRHREKGNVANQRLRIRQGFSEAKTQNSNSFTEG